MKLLFLANAKMPTEWAHGVQIARMCDAFACQGAQVVLAVPALPGPREEDPFTFYGLPLLKKELDAKVSPLGNPAMPMKMPFGSDGFQSINWPMPNLLMANIPGFESVATGLMKKMFKNKGVATVEELREACIEMDVRLIGCQMTMDVFGFAKEDFIDQAEVAGAAAFLAFAADADVSLFI